ncbi:hypothetical protein [Alkalihalobacillus sp. CinArs1]|uniref:hypothetical protein n=1 Tax=Alkalihalobacillus sp. CinArs1 TaxID=2995314 RepID=UPI0022DD1910|nr:hypothetical protein [Alkalihalobacillus sp. CinArs1]
MIELLLVIMTIVGMIVFYRKAEEPEPYLLPKIVGLVLLGEFRLEIGSVILPIGFIIFLLFMRTLKTNAKAKRGAAFFGLLVFCLSLLLPFLQTTYYEWPRNIAVQDTNFYSGSLVDELKNIQKELDDGQFNGKITGFDMTISSEGGFEDFDMQMIDGYGPEEVHYDVSLSEDDEEFIVKRKRFEQEAYVVSNAGTLTEAEFFLAQLDLVEKGMLEEDTDSYTFHSSGQREGYAVENTEKYIIDTAGKHKVENDDLPFEAILVEVCDGDCDVYEHYLFDVLERYHDVTEETVLGVARETSSDVHEWLNAHRGFQIAHETNGEYFLKRDGETIEVSEREYVEALKENPRVEIERDDSIWHVTVEHTYGEAPHTMEFTLNVETKEVIEVRMR